MRTFVRTAVFGGLLIWFAAGFAFSADLRVGAAAVDVTPRVGTPMGGSYWLHLAEGIHDPLYAKALVLEKDGVKVALISCDVGTVMVDLTTRIRELVRQATGIPAENVMVAGTHTHEGPETTQTMISEVLRGRPLELLTEWRESFVLKAAEAVKTANAKLTPARAWWAIGEEDWLPKQRRHIMTDGRLMWSAGVGNPEIERPAGPIDPGVPVVYFDTPEGKPLATYVNFAMHTDMVYGNVISGDFPGVLASLLSAYKSPDMITLYSSGSAGNVGHVDPLERFDQRQLGFHMVSAAGTILAADVIKAYRRLQPVKPDWIRVGRTVVEVQPQEITPADVEKAKRLFADIREGRFQRKGNDEFFQQVRAMKVLRLAPYNGKPIPVEIQAISLGNEVAWVTVPGEIFVELGLAIKRGSPFSNTIVVFEGNDNTLSYIPDRKGFSGGYEALDTLVKPGSGELIVDQATRLLLDLRRLETRNAGTAVAP